MLTSELADRAVRVIGMGCAVEEACPALRVPLEDWGVRDPKGRPPAEVRASDLRRRVETLIDALDHASP